MTVKRLQISPHAVISIAREGGVAFFPGLSSPRRVFLAAVNEDERNRILATLYSTAKLATPDAGKGDQTYYRVEIFLDERSNTPNTTLLIPEQNVTKELVKLWECAVNAMTR